MVTPILSQHSKKGTSEVIFCDESKLPISVTWAKILGGTEGIISVHACKYFLQKQDREDHLQVSLTNGLRGPYKTKTDFVFWRSYFLLAGLAFSQCTAGVL